MTGHFETIGDALTCEFVILLHRHPTTPSAVTYVRAGSSRRGDVADLPDRTFCYINTSRAIRAATRASRAARSSSPACIAFATFCI